VKEYFYAAAMGETLSHFTIVYVPSDRASKYRDSDRSWINECVAIGNRILKLFEANTDEVFVVDRAQATESRRSRIILIT
jgi:esterase/lipase superfamily enzyme